MIELQLYFIISKDCPYTCYDNFQLEITHSDKSEAVDAYEELHVNISADTYEKVDTAVALIELLFTPVSVSLLL